MNEPIRLSPAERQMLQRVASGVEIPVHTRPSLFPNAPQRPEYANWKLLLSLAAEGLLVLHGDDGRIDVTEAGQEALKGIKP